MSERLTKERFVELLNKYPDFKLTTGHWIDGCDSVKKTCGGCAMTLMVLDLVGVDELLIMTSDDIIDLAEGKFGKRYLDSFIEGYDDEDVSFREVEDDDLNEWIDDVAFADGVRCYRAAVAAERL